MIGSKAAATSELERKVLEHIDAHAEEGLEFFRKLVRIQSSDPPGDVREIADVCAAFGRDLGMTVQQHEPAPGRVSCAPRTPPASLPARR